MEYQIFDGHRLVSIPDYLESHPRPDLIQLDRRMQWLSAGPHGNRSGDILLLTRSGLERPIQKRYYFSGPYHSWHGSASWQDSHVPLIVARQNYPAAKLKQIVDEVAGPNPSHLSLVPIVLSLLATDLQPPAPTTAQSPSMTPMSVGPLPSLGSAPSATPAAKSQ